MQIWDTAGQVKFRSLAHSYYRSAAGIVLVYDVTDPSSFEGIAQWFSKIREEADLNAEVILLGNKIDLKNEILVD